MMLQCLIIFLSIQAHKQLPPHAQTEVGILTVKQALSEFERNIHCHLVSGLILLEISGSQKEMTSSSSQLPLS